MKQIKFRKNLSDLILSGEKTTTWRIFDDKDLREGDEVEFLVWETGAIFANARLKNVAEKTLGMLDECDWDGHEKFASKEEMYQTYNHYYKREVDENTLVKIIHFVLL